MKKKFNPHQWLNAEKKNNETRIASPATGEATLSSGATCRPQDFKDVEQVILQIESRQLDITSNYADWRNIGFAFAGKFGASGRELFHRVSRFYPEYKPIECDRQYQACLKAAGHGITIKTFFYLAKQAGIQLSNRYAGTPQPKGSSLPFGEMPAGKRGQGSNGKMPTHRERGHSNNRQRGQVSNNEFPTSQPKASSLPFGEMPAGKRGQGSNGKMPTHRQGGQGRDEAFTTPQPKASSLPFGERGSDQNNCDASIDIAVRSSLSSPLQGEVDRRQTGRRGPAHIPADSSDQTPTFPASLFPHLPAFLQKIVTIASADEERDILLLGSLVTLSSCIPSIYGIYDGKKVYPNLYLFISAQASAGKGRLVHCRQLVKPIHKMLRRQARLLKQQYEMEITEYNASKKNKYSKAEKPEKPPEKMLFIPANNSTTGVFQLLSDNDGRGLIFETEGDTLAQAFKSDYGNYSDGFRKAFHHETISYYRRTDREYVDIESPCLSTVLSGTPGQIASLIPGAENGLFSRFIFYFMNIKPVWKNVFETSAANGLDDYFTTLGYEYLGLYKYLQTIPETAFILSPWQQQQFNSFFEQIQTTYLAFQGIDYMATIRRLGLIAFRLAMVMSALRIMETGEFPGQLTCSHRDLTTILSMIKILVQHSSRVFSELPEEVKPVKRGNNKEKLLNLLPLTFNRQAYLEISTSLSIIPKTADKYIDEFVRKGIVCRESRNNYINTWKENETVSLTDQDGNPQYPQNPQ